MNVSKSTSSEKKKNIILYANLNLVQEWTRKAAQVKILANKFRLIEKVNSIWANKFT